MNFALLRNSSFWSRNTRQCQTIFDEEGMQKMTAHTKRNLANALTLMGLAPALVWMLLMAMALSGALLPWISAGVFLSGSYLLLLSLCITGPALMWSSALKEDHPDVWTKKYRIAAFSAKLVLIFGILFNVGILAWERFRDPEPPTQIPISVEESHRIQEQIDKKIRELVGRSR